MQNLEKMVDSKPYLNLVSYVCLRVPKDILFFFIFVPIVIFIEAKTNLRRVFLEEELYLVYGFHVEVGVFYPYFKHIMSSSM